MIEDDTTQPVQVFHMEAAMLLAEAVEKATRLGFTLLSSGTTVDVIKWTGTQLIQKTIPTSDTLFEASYLTNLIDWLDGVAYGRADVGSFNK